MGGELVFVGGTVRTLDPAASLLDRLAVSGAEIATEPGPHARRIDLRGACLMPGFNDSHVHFPS
jgi:predicted amidohydrolase YtcJ